MSASLTQLESTIRLLRQYGLHAEANQILTTVSSLMALAAKLEGNPKQ